MIRRAKDEAREQRIHMEIVVDAHGKEHSLERRERKEDS